MVKNVIITSCNAKYGDFLIHHWLKSLKENVDLKNIDLVILDYGLTPEQVHTLTKTKQVRVVKCREDGKIVVIRFRDMLNFLKKKSYNQVMCCDGGDIIFQKDINHLFEKDKKKFRAVCEDESLPLSQIYMNLQNSIDNRIKPQIRKYIKNQKMINAGVIFAPRNKFMKLCSACNMYVQDKNKFGPDQIIVNYLLYKEGFVKLNKEYNFVVYASGNSFKIKKGIFYNENNEKISIVHNTGGSPYMRAIKNFGYGERFNKIRFIRFYFFRGIIKVGDWLYHLLEK